MAVNGNGQARVPETLTELKASFEGRCKIKLKSAESKRLYAYRVGHFCDWAEAEAITLAVLTPLDVEKYLQSLTAKRNGHEQGLAPRTIHGHARVVKTLLRYAERHSIIPQAIRFEMPDLPEDLPKYLTEAEQDAILGGLVLPRDMLLIHLYLKSGLRLSEALALNWRDVVWDDGAELGSVTVRGGKGGKDRTTFFEADTWFLFRSVQQWSQNHLEIETGADDPVFISERKVKKRLTASGVNHLMRHLSKRAGFPVRAHLLRHTYGRNLAVAGLPPQAIMRLMGHKDIAMAQRYTALVEADVKDLYIAKVLGRNGRP
jgi:integrase/recombinase XerD